MDFKVTIDMFEGPLDLMLHLIKEKELDLFNLDIEILTEQYINYIHAMEKLRLDIAGEYLAMLATLMEYKSRKLLHKDDVEIEDDYQQEDSEQDLVKRLIEYQKYKDVTAQLQQMYSERQKQFEKPQADIVNQWIDLEETYENSSPYDLIKAMNRCLKRYKISQPYQVNITRKNISVDERKQQIKKLIKNWPSTFDLNTTLKDCNDVYDVVVTFLAVLDLVNDNYLSFSVNKEEVYFKKV
ncbi:MAG: segregation/condensation protein A [Erysipelotrichia bacterium]|nr:segregation/condensation protein A [Erysipelotrichia bacterium]